jgi:DNA modification methylase
MYHLAIGAGFSVQRWPITWVKTNRCANQAAQYNFTKNTEIAMVCRKGNAVMVEHGGTSVVIASNDEMVRLTGHKFAKPKELWQFFARHTSFSNQLIFDPFLGRGSSALSLLDYDRRVMGTELKTEHYNALLENMKTYYRKINPNAIFV